MFPRPFARCPRKLLMASACFAPLSCSMKSLRCCNSALAMLSMTVAELKLWRWQDSPTMILWLHPWGRLPQLEVTWSTRFALFAMIVCWCFKVWRSVGWSMKVPRMMPMHWWKLTTKPSTRVGSSWKTMKGPIVYSWTCCCLNPSTSTA